MNQGTLFKVS